MRFVRYACGLTQGCSPKKKWGTPETRLRQRFLNNSGLRTCCTEIILHCVSVSNQLQQWTNFCTNFSPKSGGSGGRVPPVEKVGGRSPLASPPHYTPGLTHRQTRSRQYSASVQRRSNNRTRYACIRTSSAFAAVARRSKIRRCVPFQITLTTV